MPEAYLVDMDGVLVQGREAIPGTRQFVTRLRDVVVVRFGTRCGNLSVLDINQRSPLVGNGRLMG